MKINTQSTGRVAVERAIKGNNPMKKPINMNSQIKRKQHASSKYKQPIQIP